MEYGWIVTIAIVLAMVGGFAILAGAVVDNWRARSRGKEAVDADRSRRTIEFGRCYNECMASERWDPDKEEMCTSRCTQAQVDRASSRKGETERPAL